MRSVYSETKPVSRQCPDDRSGAHTEDLTEFLTKATRRCTGKRSCSESSGGNGMSKRKINDPLQSVGALYRVHFGNLRLVSPRFRTPRKGRRPGE